MIPDRCLRLSNEVHSKRLRMVMTVTPVDRQRTPHEMDAAAARLCRLAQTGTVSTPMARPLDRRIVES